VALANPGRSILCVSGEGSAFFVVQSLWTAVAQRLYIVFIVCNNASYRILKVDLLHHWAEAGEQIRSFRMWTWSIRGCARRDRLGSRRRGQSDAPP